MDVRLLPPMSFERNVAENFKRFKQNLEIFLIASGRDEKDEK